MKVHFLQQNVILPAFDKFDFIMKFANISTRKLRRVVLSISMQQKYFFSSTFSFSGRSHVGSLFTNEEQKKDDS